MTRSGPLGLAALAALSLAAFALSMRVGVARASLSAAIADPDGFDATILGARAARVVLGALAGGALASVGAAFQALFRNPLGDPYALGVSGGAALGATVAVLLGMGMVAVPIAAFAGALASTFAVLAVARASGRVGAESLLLAGMVSNAVSNAGLAFLRTSVTTSRSQETLTILLGSVVEEPWSRVGTVAAFSLAGMAVLFAQAKALNLLALGADSAASLGVNVARAEKVVFLASSLVVAAVVSVCGLIPFVGLLVPHYVKAVTGSDHRRLLPGSFMGGAALLMVADAATRAVFPLVGSEPPVGALTALVGGPFFLVVLKGLRDREG